VSIPDDAAQKAALAVVADVYKPDYEKARTPAQKSELAKKLLGEGSATKDDPTSRFVLFRVARDIASQQGDLVTAFDAIGRISTEFEADGMQMQVDAATTAATTAVKALKLPKDHQACVALLAPLIDEAIAVDRYDHAKSLASLTLGAAREGRDAERIKQMVAKLKEVEAIAAEFERVKEAKVTLEAKPTDPDANLAVGKFLCLFKGDWKRGVTMLALGSNDDFKATAMLELEEKPDALKLGDGWWKTAESLEGTAKTRTQSHAGEWYRIALPGLSGLSKTRVERLVSQVPPTLVPKAVKDVKGEVEDTQSKSGLKDGRFDILWDGGWRFLLEVKGDAVLFYGEVNPENKFIPWVKPVSIPFKLDATNNLASADNHGRDNFHFAFQWNYATKEASRNNPATKKLEKGKVVSPLVGRWVQSNGWAIELLENGEATNTNPNGGVEATGKWQDNGNGKYSIRLGPKSEWLWNMTLQGNTLNTEMFLNGASMSKGTFARQREQGTNILRNTVLNPSQKAWTFDKSGLEAANLSDSSSFVSIPIDAARSYDLQMSVILKQAKGKNDIHIVFPFRGVMRPFVIRHDDNGNVTLSFWPKEPKLLGTPPYGVTLPSTTAFESNKARLITLKVRTDSTEVLLDGTVIFRLAGDATVTDKSEPVSLRLGSWNNRVLFQSVTVVEKKER
jgi:hypothetical protein